MEIRNLTLPIEFPAGEAGLRELGRMVTRLRTARGVLEASASSEKKLLSLSVDAAQFSTERLEYELGSFDVRLKSQPIRRALLLTSLDTPETARAIARALRAVSGVLLVDIDFAAAQGRIEHLPTVSPTNLLELIARFGASARFADAPESKAPRPSPPAKFPFALLAVVAAVLLWVGGEAASAFTSHWLDLPVSFICFALSSLFAGWRSLRAAVRGLWHGSRERNAIIAICWFAALAAMGNWREAAAGLLVLRVGQMALASLLSRLRARCRELPPDARERFSASFLYANPYMAIPGAPARRGLFLIGLITIGFVVAPYLLIPGLVAAQWKDWIYRGLILLPLASSESFFVAASVAVAAALNSGREKGLWFRGGAGLQSLTDVKGAAYAKTGVLTRGNLVVEDTTSYYGWTCADVLRVASVLQSDGQHPMARAIRDAAKPIQNGAALEASDCVSVEGGGVAGTVEEIRFFLGSRRWMQQNRVPLMRQAEEEIAAAEAQGHSIALLGVDGGLLGLLVFRDAVRGDAPQAVSALKDLGIARQILVSGDGDAPVNRIAQTVGLEMIEVSFGQEERSERVAELREQADGSVLALGDGAFDAALLDAADAGFCFDVAARPNSAFFASTAAQNNDFAALPSAIRLARRMDASLFHVWNVTLTLKAALFFAALLLPIPLPALVLAEALLALSAASGLLALVPLRKRDSVERKRDTAARPAKPSPAPAPPPPISIPKPTPKPTPPVSRPAVAPGVSLAPPIEDAVVPLEEEIPEPLLELVFICDWTADAQPKSDRVYPRWDSFVVPFYGEPLRFGRKNPKLSLAVQLEDEGVSRLQGEIRLEGKRPVIVDLHSSNGIRRNSKALRDAIPTETPEPIKFGDILYVGFNTRIEIRAPKKAD